MRVRSPNASIRAGGSWVIVAAAATCSPGTGAVSPPLQGSVVTDTGEQLVGLHEGDELEGQMGRSQGAMIPCGEATCDSSRGEVCCDESTFHGVTPTCKAPPCRVHQLCFDDAACPAVHVCVKPDPARGREVPDGYGECQFIRQRPLPCIADLACRGSCCLDFDGTRAWCSEDEPCELNQLTCLSSVDCGPHERCCVGNTGIHTFCSGECDTATSLIACGSDRDCFDEHATEAERTVLSCAPHDTGMHARLSEPLRVCRQR